MTLEEEYRLSCYEEQTTLVYSDALAIMRKLCDVLKSLHALTPPIIHRDLKLSNIILTSENLVYIVDFDTARYYESGQEQDTELLGTKEYAPPEQYGFGQSDARSDIYALGIIFNRLLTGEYPKHKYQIGHQTAQIHTVPVSYTHLICLTAS